MIDAILAKVVCDKCKSNYTIVEYDCRLNEVNMDSLKSKGWIENKDYDFICPDCFQKSTTIDDFIIEPWE